MTPECDSLCLKAYPIESETDIELLRQIRNVCKDGFSFDNDEITPQKQAAWWTLMQGRVKGWLYYVLGDCVGYGLLRLADDGCWYSSVAVVPECAGRGFGGAITADLVRRSDKTVYATARRDNPAAMRLHREADWDEVARDDRLVYYETKQHVHLGSSLEEWSKHGWEIT